MTVGLLHPGEMGAAVGAVLRARDETVLWASAGRSEATAARAEQARLEDAGTTEELARRCDVMLSVCPPHAAVEVARQFAHFEGIYVDANAISPETARTVARLVGRYVDGGIIGSPPRKPGTTRLYLSGDESKTVAALFAGTIIDARIVSNEIGAASTVKMAYAAWTKGTSALLLAVRALARIEGVEQTLLDEWRTSLPHLEEQSAAASQAAASKGWRWVGEMNEIAEALADAGLPDGFHRAAAEIYRRSPRERTEDDVLEHILGALLDDAPTARPA